MSAGAWDAMVQADLAAIEARAMTLYALTAPSLPWPSALSSERDRFTERAGRELWGEGALSLDPSEPYYESADDL